MGHVCLSLWCSQGAAFSRFSPLEIACSCALSPGSALRCPRSRRAEKRGPPGCWCPVYSSKRRSVICGRGRVARDARSPEPGSIFCLVCPSPTGSYFLPGVRFLLRWCSSARYEAPFGVPPGVASRLTARSPRVQSLVVRGAWLRFGCAARGRVALSSTVPQGYAARGEGA
ncbi:hypothetical protein NDU88_010016 [Pleurodeles waltl]|uniref:Uncharacterized protein n=1 Tax=Pleurodeles waltl TaxID=8319 RepID=A0AAV7QWU6_PLEWA|nr:hypothetical protein NDU88_010016 [Pleurodeles waltl]